MIVEQYEIEAEDTGFMLESVKLPEVRSEVCEFFRSISQPTQMNRKESFVALGWLCSAILDNIEIRP